MNYAYHYFFKKLGISPPHDGTDNINNNSNNDNNNTTTTTTTTTTITTTTSNNKGLNDR